jgi:hypothetical protein
MLCATEAIVIATAITAPKYTELSQRSLGESWLSKCCRCNYSGIEQSFKLKFSGKVQWDGYTAKFKDIITHPNCQKGVWCFCFVCFLIIPIKLTSIITGLTLLEDVWLSVLYSSLSQL